MAVPLWASIFAKRMGFFPSPASVIAAIAGFWIASIGASARAADPIPGPPLAVSAADRAGAFCAVRESSVGDTAGFAAGVAITAIAARRRDRV